MNITYIVDFSDFTFLVIELVCFSFCWLKDSKENRSNFFQPEHKVMYLVELIIDTILKKIYFVLHVFWIMSVD